MLTSRECILKKVRGNRKGETLSQVRFEAKYIAIQKLHKEKCLAIALLCEITGIARSAYYKWLNRIPSARELQNEEIIKEMKSLHEKVSGIYGYRRMMLNINRKFKQHFNHKRIIRLIRITICHSKKEKTLSILYPTTCCRKCLEP